METRSKIPRRKKSGSQTFLHGLFVSVSSYFQQFCIRRMFDNDVVFDFRRRIRVMLDVYRYTHMYVFIRVYIDPFVYTYFACLVLGVIHSAKL